MENCLVIYAERPSAGHVIAQLAKHVGEEEASGVYARVLFDLIYEVIQADLDETRIEIWGLTPGDVPFFSEAFPEVRTRLQIGIGLEDRLATTFEKTFSGQASNVVIVNAEYPRINLGIIKQAFDALNEASVVLGPTDDNDIYLVGMKNPGIPIFHGVDGSSNAFLSIIDNLDSINGDYKLLEKMSQLNTYDDIIKWRNNGNDK